MNYKRIRFPPYGKGDSESTKMMIKEENNESFIFYKDSLQEILWFYTVVNLIKTFFHQ